MSEKRLYVLKNNDDTLLRKIAKFLYQTITGYSGSWAQGLIELYTAEEGIADGRYDLWDKVAKASKVSITDKNQLKVKVGLFNNPMLFELDGWTGRYGLSSDFLISLHLATLSPDLVTTIAQTFDTRAQVYLDYVKEARVESFFHTSNMDDDEYIPLEDLEDYMNDSSSWNFFDNWFLSRKEAQTILEECDIDSLKSGKYTCGGEDPSEVLYCYDGGTDYKSVSGDCFTEVVADDVVSWASSVFENQYVKKKQAWSHKGSSGNGMVNIKVMNGTADEDDADAFFKDCGSGLFDGADEPGILFHEGGWWNHHTTESDVDLYKIHDILEALDSMYKIVQDDIAGGNNFKIVGEPGPSSCPLTYRTILNPDSEYYLENYLAFDDFKTIANDNDGYTEVVIGAWQTNRELKREGDEGYNPDYDAEIILSMLVRNSQANKDSNNYSLSLVLYRTYDFVEMVEKGFDGNMSGKTCSEKTSKKESCQNCRRYVSDIIKALKKIDDEHYKTYVPHLARVVGSWFRDTYFIIPENDSSDVAIQDAYDDYDEYKSGDLAFNNIEIIKNDELFLEETGELWTDYIYYDDENGKEYDYAIFVINPDGSYLESQADIDKWKNEYYKDLPEEIYKSIGILNKNNINYYGYIDVTPDENSGIPKDTDIEQLFKDNEVAFVKRAKTSKSEKTKDFAGWSAYDFDGFQSDEKKALDINEDTPEKIKRVHDAYNFSKKDDEEDEKIFYYTLLADENVVIQKDDAQRGMTNEKIKYLFKNKKYYKYDGTTARAFDIRDDWQECIKLLANTDTIKYADTEELLKKVSRTGIKTSLFGHGDLFNAIKEAEADGEIDMITDTEETIINGYIDAIYYKDEDILNYLSGLKFARDFDGDKKADLVSKNLEDNLDIGDQFDGLEITESTKFDYDPRNPELINKIDINTESLAAFSILENTHTADADYAYRDFKELICELDYFDKEDLTAPASDVLEWILPESKFSEWPLREYDKVNEFGTMVHSTEMYSNLQEITNIHLSQTASNSGNSSQILTPIDDGFEKNDIIVSPATAKILEIGTVTVDNENTVSILNRIYVGEKSQDQLQKEETDGPKDKTLVTQEEYDKIESFARSKENDTASLFGKSYETGYIKLEVIGSKSLTKFEKLHDTGVISKEIYDSLNAFYKDYFSESHNKTICDSYIIYIEGIDFTGSLEDGSSFTSIDETVLNKLFSQYTNGANLSTNQKVTTSDISKDEDFKIIIGSNEYKTNYYELRPVPGYYPQARQDEMKENEELKKSAPSIIKLDEEIYIKAGTILGIAGNANIKIVMKDKDNAVVENVEDYIDEYANRKSIRGTIAKSYGGEISATENGIRTEEDIIYAIENVGWEVNEINQIKSEFIDGLLEIQSTYDIDPLAALAVFHWESKCGIAYPGHHRIANIQKWSGMNDKELHEVDGQFTCWNSYYDAILDFGNYVRNSPALRGATTMDDLESFNGYGCIFEGAATHDAETYNQLKEVLKNR